MPSVVEQTPYNEYTGNGVATVYPYEFELLDADDLVVTIDGVVIPASEFTLAGVGVQGGGTVTFDTAPGNLTDVLLSRDLALQREIDYQSNGDLPSPTVNLDFNRIWQALQGFWARITNSIRAPYPEQLDELPPAADRANTVLAFDADGQPTVMVPSSGSAADVLIQLARDDDFQLGAALVGFGPSLVYADGTVGAQLRKFSDTSSAANGDALVGSKRIGAPFIAATLHERLEWHPPHLFDAMTTAQRDDVIDGAELVDVVGPCQDAIDSMEARGGGVLEAYGAPHRLEDVLLMKRGVTLRGQGCKKPGGTYDGVTIFRGVHTGSAVLSLKSAHECAVENLMVYGDSVATPKTGILCGRGSASSAGLHKFSRVHVDGYYSEACYYLIASESNKWSNIFYTLRGGGALYGIYASQGDDLSVDTLTGSSNLENSFFHLEGINMTDDVAASGIYLSTGAGTGSWAFYSPYIIQHKGSYITLSAGAADGLDGLGPFVFVNASGEIYNQAGGGAPQQGYNLLGTTALRGLQISGGRFQFVNSTGSERSMKMAAGVSLKQPHISLQTMDNATAELVFSNIDDGYVSVGAQAFTAPTLTNSWVDTFATSNGFQVPGYYRDPMGFVHLRGVTSGGTVNSSMFTLPAGYRPGTNEMFGVLNGASNVIGRVDVGSDGTVNLRTGGSNTYVDLSGITFKAV